MASQGATAGGGHSSDGSRPWRVRARGWRLDAQSLECEDIPGAMARLDSIAPSRGQAGVQTRGKARRSARQRRSPQRACGSGDRRPVWATSQRWDEEIDLRTGLCTPRRGFTCLSWSGASTTCSTLDGRAAPSLYVGRLAAVRHETCSSTPNRSRCECHSFRRHADAPGCNPSPSPVAFTVLPPRHNFSFSRRHGGHATFPANRLLSRPRREHHRIWIQYRALCMTLPAPLVNTTVATAIHAGALRIRPRLLASFWVL